MDNKILLTIIKKAKSYLKKNKTMQDAFKRKKLDIELIDVIPTMFDEIDASAKTKQGIVILNIKLLEDGLIFKDIMYLVHEYTHFCQQAISDDAIEKTAPKGKNYLFNDEELEAFHNQLNWLEEECGKDEAKEYIDQLVDFHKIKNKKELINKIKEAT